MYVRMCVYYDYYDYCCYFIGCMMSSGVVATCDVDRLNFLEKTKEELKKDKERGKYGVLTRKREV